MKRIVAKEFLMLVGCMVILLIVAVFGRVRNSWLDHQSASIGNALAEQRKALDSLNQRAIPRHLDFLDLFEPQFVRDNFDVFLTAPFWTADPFLVGLPKGSLYEQHAEYRQRVYNGLVSDFPEFKTTQTEFNQSLDSDAAYADRVYGILASIFKDLKRPKEEFRTLINAPVQNDPFKEFGGSQDAPQYAPQFDRRYLMCVVRGLDRAKYFTPERLNRLMMRCGRTTDQMDELSGLLAAYKALASNSWRPPADAAEVYNPRAPKNEITTWEAALGQRGVPKNEITKHIQEARRDTANFLTLMVGIRGVLCDTIPNVELRNAFDYLKERRVLRCNMDDLLYTLQNKAIPPSQEALDAVAKHQVKVDELLRTQSDTRASLWDETKQWAVVKWGMILLLVLVYPLRLLVLGTLWAIKVLRK